MTAAALRLVEGSSMDKTKALDAALSQIERNFGKGSIMRLGKNNKAMDVDPVSTGSLGLDIALGIGGLRRGRVVEIYGPESSGKTTLALHCLAEAQKKGGICAFIDAEHALDPIYARKLGVNVDDLLISQPDAGEQALEIADTLVRSGAVDVLVIDSVAALVPRAELQAGRVRYHVWRGHRRGVRAHRSGREGRRGGEVRLLVLLRQPAHRPGARERQALPQGQSRYRRQDRDRSPAKRRAHRRAH